MPARLHLFLALARELDAKVNRRVPSDCAVGSPDPSHPRLLAELLLEAYRGGPDQEEDTLDEAEAEVHRTLSGHYGPFVREASFVLSDAGGVVAASLVVRHRGAPMLAHALTHPRRAGESLGTALIALSVAALRACGETELHLAVHAESRAAKLYERMGFMVWEG